MTKKDFELIARTISEHDPEGGSLDPAFARITKHTLALDFADVLASTNPRFDRERFLRACGVEA